MSLLSFDDLVSRFGVVLAYHYLIEIEKAAHIPSWEMADIDPESRLAHALRMQDEPRDQTLAF